MHATMERHRDETGTSMSTRVAVGAVSGLVAGIVFAMLAMMYAWAVGLGLWAPVRMIATIAGYEMGSTFAAVPVMVGVAIHMMLSALYGAVFAVVAWSLDRTLLLAAGIAFGLAVYVVNFHVMAQFEPFTTFQMLAGNWFEILIHGIYGLLLAAGIAGWRSTRSTRHA